MYLCGLTPSQGRMRSKETWLNFVFMAVSRLAANPAFMIWRQCVPWLLQYLIMVSVGNVGWTNKACWMIGALNQAQVRRRQPEGD
jgi:hypothetical protein